MAPSQTVEPKDLPTEVKDSAASAGSASPAGCVRVGRPRRLPCRMPCAQIQVRGWASRDNPAAVPRQPMAVPHCLKGLACRHGPGSAPPAGGRRPRSGRADPSVRSPAHHHCARHHARPPHRSRAKLGIGRNTITRKIQELGLDVSVAPAQAERHAFKPARLAGVRLNAARAPSPRGPFRYSLNEGASLPQPYL